MAYESFRPAPLPPNPPIEVSGELVTKLMHSSQEAPDRSRSHLQHTQESCQRLRPSGVFFKTFSNAQSWSRYSFRSTISAFLLFSQYSILYAEYQIIFPFRKLFILSDSIFSNYGNCQIRGMKKCLTPTPPKQIYSHG